MQKYFKTILLVLLFSFLLNQFAPFAYSQTLQEQLEEVNRELERIRNEKRSLQNEIDSNNFVIQGYNAQLNALYAEVAVLNSDIDELEAQIKQMEINIEILNEDIEQKKKEIEASEKTIVDLEKESNLRIKNNYMSFRMYGNPDGGSRVLGIENINAFFKDSQYKELIQASTNYLWSEVARLRLELIEKKERLNNSLAEQKKEKELVEIKRNDLAIKKEEVDIKVANYLAQVNLLQSRNNSTRGSIEAFSREEIQKKAQSELLQQQIFNSFSPSNPGEYVLAGKYIGRQGSTGFSTGPHLHFSVQVNNIYQDPCAYLLGGVCGYGNTLQWPLNPVSYYTSPFGNRCFSWNGTPYCDFHSGIDIVGHVWNAPVYAAHNGYLYKGVDWYGALYIIICENTNCNVGMKTGYWHLSEY